jgi:hypothetical protein
MNTFKQSAIEILRKAKTPLHYNEITKQALESGILELMIFMGQGFTRAI